MKAKKLKEAERLLIRAAVEFDAVVRFFEKNESCQEYTINYDGTECDGSCLMEDCRNSLAGIVELLGTDTVKRKATP